MNQIAPDTLTEAKRDDLLKRLDSHNKAIREAAIREARHLPPGSLIALIVRERSHYRRRLQRMGLIGGGALFVSVFALMAPLDQASVTAVFVGTIAVTVFAAVDWCVPVRAHASLEDILKEGDDPRLLPTILSLLSEFPPLRATVKHLLPRLRIDHTRNWTQEHTTALLSLLGYDDIELTLAILKALEQIGDASAIPVVEQLANAQAISPRVQQVREAARDCLPFLQLRAREQQEQQTLLRASAHADRSDALLRPATANHSAEEHLLLRPKE